MLQKLNEARKALATLAVMEAAAVSFGVIGGKVEFYITAGLGILGAGTTYLVGNPDKAPDTTGSANTTAAGSVN